MLLFFEMEEEGEGCFHLQIQAYTDCRNKLLCSEYTCLILSHLKTKCMNMSLWPTLPAERGVCVSGVGGGGGGGEERQKQEQKQTYLIGAELSLKKCCPGPRFHDVRGGGGEEGGVCI